MFPSQLIHRVVHQVSAKTSLTDVLLLAVTILLAVLITVGVMALEHLSGGLRP